MWVLFQVPCPTPKGESAEDLYQKRVEGISAAMKESAVANGCRFHRAWHASDGSSFFAIANWETAEGANRFFAEWNIEDEAGEIMIRLEGDIGLVPLGG
jgi:hypothetical protein